jgi:hypothetical protein
MTDHTPPQQPNRPERLRENYERCDVSNNGTENPLGFDEFKAAIRTRIERAIPDKIHAGSIERGIPANYKSDDNADTQKGYNRAVDEFKSNIQKELGI